MSKSAISDHCKSTERWKQGSYKYLPMEVSVSISRLLEVGSSAYDPPGPVRISALNFDNETLRTVTSNSHAEFILQI